MSWALAVGLILLISVFSIMFILIGVGMVSTFYLKICSDVPLVCNEPFFIQGYRIVVWALFMLIIILLVVVVIELVYLRIRYSW